jgi:hypothetical protein
VALLAAGCGDDGGAATETTTLDPGVTFEDEVTVPTGSVPPGTVRSEPGEIPPDFPEDFPLPEGADVELGSVGEAEGEVRLAVDLSIEEGDPAEVLAFYRDAVADAGFAVLLDEEDGQGSRLVGQLVFETDEYVGSVLISGDGEGGVLVSLTATAPQ